MGFTRGFDAILACGYTTGKWRPKGLSLDSTYVHTSYIISVDLGGTNTRIALVNTALSIREKVSFSTKDFFSQRDRLLFEIAECSKALLHKHGIRKDRILGMGIGVPGLVDFSKGKVYYLPNVPYWHNTPLKAILQRTMRCRVFVDNDTNMMALAELRLGAARGVRNAICLTLGTGVGGGLIIAGELFRGSQFCAGEIGHIPLAIKGKKCNCGGQGCLETYVGNEVLLAEAKKKLKNNDITLEKLSELSKKGNIAALKIYKDFAEKIGIALSGIVNVINPDVIVVGGGLSFAGDFIFRIIKETIQVRSMPVQAKTVTIKKASLGTDAGLIGAALLVKENIAT